MGTRLACLGLLLAGCGGQVAPEEALAPGAEEPATAVLVSAPDLAAGQEQGTREGPLGQAAPVFTRTLDLRVEKVPRDTQARTAQVGVETPAGRLVLGELELGDQPTLETSLEVPEDTTRVWALVTDEGYCAIEGWCLPAPEDQLTRLRLDAYAGGTLRGTARLAGGGAPTDLRLTLVGSAYVRNHATRVQPDGSFAVHFSGGPATTLRARAAGQGGAVVELEPFTAEDPPQDVQVLLRGEGELLGRLVDEAGAPVAGVEVGAILPSQLPPSGRRLERWSDINPTGTVTAEGLTKGSSTTDPSGAFAIRGLRPGDYVLLARLDGQEVVGRLHADVVATGPEVRTYVAPAQRVEVVLVDHAGQPVPFGVRTWARPTWYPSINDRSHTGRWRMGESVLVSLNPKGIPWSGAEAYLGAVTYGRDRPPAPSWIETEEAHRRIAVLAMDEPYELRVESLHHPAVVREVRLTPGDARQRVRVELPPRQEPGTLRLTVAPEGDLTHIRRYAVSLLSEAGTPILNGYQFVLAEDQLGQPGSFELNLPAGRYRVDVRPLHPNAGSCVIDGQLEAVVMHSPAQAWVQVGSGATQELVLEPAAQGELWLWLPGRGTWQVRVQASGSGAGGALQLEEPAGRFLLALAPGTYDVRLLREGEEWAGEVRVRPGRRNHYRLQGQGLEALSLTEADELERAGPSSIDLDEDL